MLWVYDLFGAILKIRIKFFYVYINQDYIKTRHSPHIRKVALRRTSKNPGVFFTKKNQKRIQTSKYLTGKKQSRFTGLPDVAHFLRLSNMYTVQQFKLFELTAEVGCTGSIQTAGLTRRLGFIVKSINRLTSDSYLKDLK